VVVDGVLSARGRLTHVRSSVCHMRVGGTDGSVRESDTLHTLSQLNMHVGGMFVRQTAGWALKVAPHSLFNCELRLSPLPAASALPSPAAGCHGASCSGTWAATACASTGRW
jgi:hypothetical protein